MNVDQEGLGSCRANIETKQICHDDTLVGLCSWKMVNWMHFNRLVYEIQYTLGTPLTGLLAASIPAMRRGSPARTILQHRRTGGRGDPSLPKIGSPISLDVATIHASKLI